MNDIIACIKKHDYEMAKIALKKKPELILEMDENQVLLPFLAARTGDLNFVSYIVEYTKASMNMRDAKGRTILHYAAESDSVELARYLVEQVGMDILQGDFQRITPLETAGRCKNRHVQQYFEQRVGCGLEDMYKNPVRSGFFADPSIVRVGDDYYMVNSSFTYFPCIPISHSKDLIHWDIIGHGITDPEESCLLGLESGRGYWAPDISYYGEKFYITATYRTNEEYGCCRRQIVISASNPEGPYSRPVFIDEDGIDPSLFTDEDGKRYMLLNRGARIFQLSEDGTKKISESKLIWYGANKRAPEGPHLIKVGGFYYLFLAEGGTGLQHQISAARSTHIMGPYEPCPYNPIMKQLDSDACIQRAGHGKPVQAANGEWYMVYLCGRPVNGKYTILGRETALDPIYFTEDGWPLVNQGKGPSALAKKPMGTIIVKREPNYIMDKNWMWAGIPDPAAYDRKEKGVFRLYGGAHDLHCVIGKHVLVRRQTAFELSISVELSYNCNEEGQETGLTCYYDENTYLTFGVRRQQNSCVLQVAEQVGNEYRIAYAEPIRDGRIELSIDIHYFERTFYYQLLDSIQCAEVQTIPLSSKRTKCCHLSSVTYLSDEGHHEGKRFTGAMVGIYGISGDAENPSYGEFKKFHIR